MNIQSLFQVPRMDTLSAWLIPIFLVTGPAFAQDADDDQPATESALEGQSTADILQRMRAMEMDLHQLQRALTDSGPGAHQFMVTGFANTSFSNLKGKDSSFTTSYSPVILYKFSDSFLFESELEFSLAQSGEVEVGVGYANGSFILNDNWIVGAGKFLTPFGIFGERIHPVWINKLPTVPLTAGHGGIVPTSSIGAFARGGARTGSTKWNYSFYVSNGPELEPGSESTEAAAAGQLHFNNNADSNNAKSVGARIGCLPVAELEIGVSYLTGGVTPSGSEIADANSTLMGVDLSYNPKMSPTHGRVEVRGEWVVSNVDDVVYNPGGNGPLQYNNERSGGYFQFAYRLPGSDMRLSPWEGVARYDTLNQPQNSPQLANRERITFGLNHWLTPSSVVKAAYQVDDRNGAQRDQDGFVLQFAVGF